MVIVTPNALSGDQPVRLISESTFADVVARYTDNPADCMGATGGAAPVYPFDDPLFDFIVTCRSDEAAYETAPEIARGYRGADVDERGALEALTAPLDPRAQELSERFMSRWGYRMGLDETVRALRDLVRSRTGRGLCPVPVALCWLAHQSALSSQLAEFLPPWRQWKSAAAVERAQIESQFENLMGPASPSVVDRSEARER